MLNVDEIVKTPDDGRIRKFLEMLASGKVMSNEYLEELGRCSRVQPFVSPVAWSLFAVYLATIVFSVSTMKVLQLGQDPRKFLKEAHWASIIAPAMPADEFQKIGSSKEFGLQWALGRLEHRILEELRNSLDGRSAGLESLTDAQRILQVAETANDAALKGVVAAAKARD
jgi:hypothetical protein